MFVTIEGENFNGIKRVMFGERPAQFSVTASTQIRAVVPPGILDSKITVSNEEHATSTNLFKLVGPAPVIDQLDAWVGAPGEAVVIRGINFVGVKNAFDENGYFFFTYEQWCRRRLPLIKMILTEQRKSSYSFPRAGIRILVLEVSSYAFQK